MSRSRKKHSYVGMTCAESDAPFKRVEHRRERRTVRVALHATADDTDPRLHKAPFGNPWGSPKDGKQHWDNPKAKRK